MQPPEAPPLVPAAPPGLQVTPAAARGLVAVGIVAVSCSAVLVRVAEAPALAIALWRCAGGAVALAPAALRSGARPRGRQRRALWLGGAFLAVHFALFIGSLAYTTVASAVVLTATVPVFTGIGSALFLRQPPTRRAWAGIAIALLGAVVVGLADAGSAVASAPAPLLGDAMAIGAAVAVTGYLLLGQVARASLPVSAYGLHVYGSAAVLLLAACLLTGTPLTGFGAVTWWALLAMVVGPQLLGHTVFNLILGVLPATTIAVVVLAEPLGSGLLAFLLLGELPNPLFFAGAPLLLAGVVLAATRSRPAVG